jgi:L-alanine-DL-glutamate epimerase-like enolase superfamily enzyme
MRIVDVRTHVLVDPGYDKAATSSSQDDIVVEIETDDGTVGIGESDVNPWIAQACIDAPGTHTMGQGLREMLLGQDPLEVEAMWERLYTGSAMNGRRGAVIHAMGAIDVALHDLRGRILGKPCHAQLGGAVRRYVMPYASLQPEVRDIDQYHASVVEWALRAKMLGFRAAKLECTFAGPYAHMELSAPWQRVTEIVSSVRSAVGPDMRLMVDVQYAFADAESALAVMRDWEPYDLYFVETPLPSDDLAGYARLAREQPIPIAAGEWLATRFEFQELVERGMVQVAQPDMGRVGGLTEAMRVSRMVEGQGRVLVPHVWKTGISVAAALHFAAASNACAMIEFLPAALCASPLRRELVLEEPVLEEGMLAVPEAPGLGVTLNREALDRFETAAAAARVR